MRKFSISLAVIAAVLSVAMVMSMMPINAATATTGNGAPSGAHYNLNIIGVPKGKTADMTTGGRIFVPLYGKTNIQLVLGSTFQVLNADGTNGNAVLQLPDPYANGFNSTNPQAVYQIYVRALGKPSGTANLSTAIYDPTTNSWWYSLNNVTVTRKHGQSVFKDDTLALTTIYADLGSGLQSYPLFGNSTYQYFWNYDNNGLKLLQMRFYMVQNSSGSV